MNWQVFSLGVVFVLLMGGATAAMALEGTWFQQLDELEVRADQSAEEAQEILARRDEMDAMLGASLTDADTARRATEAVRKDVAGQVARWDRAHRQMDRDRWLGRSYEARSAKQALAASRFPASSSWRQKVWLLADVDDDVEQGTALLGRRAQVDVELAYWRAQKESARASRSWLIARAGGANQADVDREFEAMIEILERRLGQLETQDGTVDFHRQKGAIIPPVSQAIDHPFGPREREDSPTAVRHTGLTYLVESGTDVHSIGDGLVVAARRFPGFGKVIIVDHDGDYHSLYAHLEGFEVDEGDRVDSRQIIGRSGESGSLEGPKLYFEMRHRGVPFDPVEWFVH